MLLCVSELAQTYRYTVTMSIWALEYHRLLCMKTRHLNFKMPKLTTIQRAQIIGLYDVPEKL